MLHLVSGALLGCSGGVVGADYTLHLTPVASASQEPFEGVDQLDLVLTPAVGDPMRVTLDGAASGATPEVSGLPPLEDAQIVVEGYADGELVLRGRTEPITASEGVVEADVFVARTEAAAWLGSLGEGVHLPLLAPLGGGRFWLGGGAANNRAGEPRKGTDSTHILSLAPPGEGLGFAAVGTLPAYVDADGESQTERMGAAVTPLTVAGTDAGKLLVSGGAPIHPYLYDGQPTASVALYDPATDGWEELAEGAALREPRALHLAVENLLGNVVLWGGLGVVDSDGVLLPGAIEFYDRAARTVRELDVAALGHVSAAATDLGADGTLLCGGARLGGNGWSSSEICARVPIDGSSTESFEELPVGLAGAAMVTLPDGRVLITGGATASTAVDADAYAEARGSAWLYNPDTGLWGALSGTMDVARAGHRMVPLADGRVLVIGGSQSFNPFFPPPDPISCIEVYDPESGVFTSVEDCTAEDDAGGLPGRTYEPQVAYDPAYGVLIVGGIDATGGAASGVSIYVPGP